MEKDNALRKVLQQPVKSQLPFGFENRVMKQVFMEAERKRRRRYLSGIALATLISLLLAGSVIFMFYYYFDIRISLKWMKSLPQESHRMYFFFTYISSLVLLLLLVEGILRKARRRQEE